MVIKFDNDPGLFIDVDTFYLFLNTPIQEKTGSYMEARPKGPSASAVPCCKNKWLSKKFQDGASKYLGCQIDTRGKNESLKIYRLKVNRGKFW